MNQKATPDFFRLEAASGIILFGALLLILIVANTPLYSFYHHLIEHPITLAWGDNVIHKPLEAWVNEGLMAMFFMLLSLEMKREILDGELSKPSQVILPFATAIGGMVVPIAVYLLITPHNTVALRGWAIPTTTDIALVLGLIAIMGKRIPASLKIWIIALSIVDDVIAIFLIAVYYADSLSLMSLALAAIGVAILILFNRCKVRRIAPYMMVGVFIWLAVLKSGVHATLAGTAIGFCVPFANDENGQSPLKRLEHALHPWVAFVIMPLFVLINAGISFSGTDLGQLFSGVSLAIILGLFVGKQLGIFATGYILIKLGWAKLPHGATMLQFYGVCVLAGIGFTMSVFMATLAFNGTIYELVSKQGILLASFISAVWGITVLLYAHKIRKPHAD